MKYISARDNKNFKELQKLKMKKHRDRSGLFLAEGVNLVLDAAARGADVREIIFDESAEDRPGFAELIKLFPEKTLLMKKNLFREISDTVNSQGVIAVMGRKEKNLQDLAGRDFYLVLDGISDPGNLGTVFRTALAFGAGGVLLLEGCADPYGPKTVRASMGAVFSLDFCTCTFEEAEMFLSASGVRIMELDAAEGENIYRTGRLADPAAFVLGSEAQGIKKHFAQVVSLHIPMENDSESLNVAAAAAVVLSEVHRVRRHTD